METFRSKSDKVRLRVRVIQHLCPQGSVLASDAFFPFSWGDAVEKACQAGVAAIAHPGGSVRDQVLSFLNFGLGSRV